MFDLPWMPLYLLCAYLLHAYLGAIAVAGACVLAVLPVATEFLTRYLAGAVHRAAIARNAAADSTASNADVLKATASATDATLWLVAYDRRANGEYSVLRGNVGGDNVVKLCVNFRSRRGLE